MSVSTIGFPDLAAVVVVTLFVSLAVLFIWSRIIRQRASGTIAREDAYHQLAEQATSALAQATAEQEKIAANMEELRTRVAAIESMLREVG